MIVARWVRLCCVGVSIAFATAVACCGEQPVEEAVAETASPAAKLALPSLEEARGRAKLLHETLHATLQAVHHDFYEEDEGLPIPAVSLGRVFQAIEERQNVKLRWLAVNADAMNVEHKPRDEFERSAVTALGSGQAAHDLAEPGVYRHAGAITLKSECLKCHLPNRRSTADRLAGLVISIPYRND
jgi:hypothetical protein